MELDVRLPMGLLFLLMGAILALVGLRDAGLTLLWGVLILAFGAVNLALAWRARRRPRI